jgi:hypothetical protein
MLDQQRKQDAIVDADGANKRRLSRNWVIMGVMAVLIAGAWVLLSR